MESKVVIRQLSGDAQVMGREFPVKLHKSITFGREPACEISFPSGQDHIVSRLHCKISIGSGANPVLSLLDLDSRNGTFLNRQRISGQVTISPGDVIQLGPGGPELEFDMEPRPAKPVRPLAYSALEATVPSWDLPPLKPEPPPAPQPLPKKRTFPAIAVISGLLLAGAGAVAYLAPHGDRLTPAQISAKSAGSMVRLDAVWKLGEAGTALQLYHAAIPNIMNTAEGKTQEIVARAGGGYIPAFLKIGQTIEPLLTTDSAGGKYRPIGGTVSGSGFVVSGEGLVLTSRDVTIGWQSRYVFPGWAGVVLELDAESRIKTVTPVNARSLAAWVPAKAKLILQGNLEAGSVKLVESRVEGYNDSLEATVAGTSARIPAKLVKVSSTKDVALAKIDLPPGAAKVEFADAPKAAPGDPVMVIGSDAPASVGRLGNAWSLNIHSNSLSGAAVFDDRGRVIGIFTSGPAVVPIRYGIELMGRVD